MRMKRVISIALSAVLLGSTATVAASAQETEVKTKTYHYVALGDSVTAGYGLSGTTTFEKHLTASLSRIVNCSSSLIPGSFSFNPSALYWSPLVLKKRLRGSPLFLHHCVSSSRSGFSSLILRTVKEAPWASNHFCAFWQVLHLG